MRKIFALGALIPLVLFFTASLSRAQSVSADDYRRLLRDYQKAMQNRPTPADAAALRQRFERIKSVSTSGTSSINVDNAKEIAALKIRESGGGKMVDKADKQRSALLQSLNVPPPAASPAHDPKAQANAILSAEEFRPAVLPASKKNWLAQTLEWMQNQVQKFLRWLFGKPTKLQPIPGLAQFFLYFLYFLLGVAALTGLFFLVRFALERSAQKERKGRVTGGGVDLMLDIADPLGAAQESAAKGDYRAALRLAYIATLRRLAGAGLIILQENRTNWEYQSALRRRSQDAYTILLPATRLFDNIWYGARPATAAEYQAVVAAHDALPRSPAQAENAASERERT